MIVVNFKRFFNWAYVRIFLDRKVVDLLSAYYQLSKREIIWLLKNGGRINNDFWLMQSPKTNEEKKRFYEITPFYIFELSLWHMTLYQKKFRKTVLEISRGNVLDFGGGIGDVSILLAKNGFNVEYADVSGNTYNYARWAFTNANLSVKMTNLSESKVSGKYDTIICIDVIEHLPNAKEVFENLASMLNAGGTFIVTNLHTEEFSKYHPMHEKIDLDGDDYLRSLNLFKTEKPWLLIKK